MGTIVVFPRNLDRRTLSPVCVLWEQTVAHRGAALEGQAELAAVSETRDNIVAVDRALWRGSLVFLDLGRSGKDPKGPKRT